MSGLFSTRKTPTVHTSRDRRLAAQSQFMAQLPAAMSEASVAASQERWLTLGKDNKPQSVQDWAGTTWSMASMIGAMYSQAITTRRDYMLMSTQMRQHYIYWTILDLVSQDCVNMDDHDDTFEFGGKYADELNELSEALNLNSIIQDMAPDLIDFGEYALRTEIESGKGLVRLYDDAVPLDLLAVYENGVPKNFVSFDMTQRALMIEPAYTYAHFVVGNSKIRMRSDDYMTNAFGTSTMFPQGIPDALRQKMGDFVKFGSPFFWGVMQSIRMLQMLETLPIAIKLNQISQSHIVQIKMSQATELVKLQEMLHKYEQILNTPVGIDFANKQITVAEVMPIVGRVRAVPNFMEGDAGAFEPVDVRHEQSVDDLIQNSEKYRQIICGSLGIPYTMLYGSEDLNLDKVAELRMFSRYTRRLRTIQRAQKRGLVQIAIMHLVNSGKKGVQRKDIDVIWKRNLTDVGGLEELEIDNARQSLVSDSMDFAEKILTNPLTNAVTNRQKLVTWLSKRFDCLTDGESFFDEVSDDVLDAIIIPGQMMTDDDGNPILAAEPAQNSNLVPAGGNGNGNGNGH